MANGSCMSRLTRVPRTERHTRSRAPRSSRPSSVTEPVARSPLGSSPAAARAGLWRGSS